MSIGAPNEPVQECERKETITSKLNMYHDLAQTIRVRIQSLPQCEGSMRILLEAAPGGHLAELSRIWPSLAGHQRFLLTVNVMQGGDVGGGNEFPFPVYFIPHWFTKYTGNRFVDYFRSALTDSCANLLFCLRLFRAVNPNLLITTGCSTTIVNCLLAKTRGMTIIYIESPARLEEPSFTGKVAYWFADLFLVQWKSLLKAYGKKAQYWGSVL